MTIAVIKSGHQARLDPLANQSEHLECILLCANLFWTLEPNTYSAFTVKNRRNYSTCFRKRK
jgi:hypothetical protein